MKRHYGLVLKAHIAIATARFPKGTRGQDLDPFARRPLWQAGLDFDHGTGHGVGSYLSVHEGPQRISRTGSVELEPGMILSNEPGLLPRRQLRHQAGKSRAGDAAGTDQGRDARDAGLRDADARAVRPAADRCRNSCCPDELAWLNAYHARVRREIEPVLLSDDRAWLRHATAPIG